MAAARDQAARIVRAEPDTAEDAVVREAAAAPIEPLRPHLAEETVARRTSETPDRPATDAPSAAPAVAPGPAAPKSGKRKPVLISIGALLALAVAGYGVHYF